MSPSSPPQPPPRVRVRYTGPDGGQVSGEPVARGQILWLHDSGSWWRWAGVTAFLSPDPADFRHAMVGTRFLEETPT